MKLTHLNITNYKSINSLHIDFPAFYSAICGKNDSGKSNVISSIQSMFAGEDYYSADISFAEDVPKWGAKEVKERIISLESELLIFKDNDAGLYTFLADYLALPEPGDTLTVKITIEFSSENQSGSVSLIVEGKPYERLKAEGA